MISKRFFLVGFLLLGLMACSQPEIFYEFHSFPEAVWSRNESVTFDVNIADSFARYDVFLEIRNNNDYPFRNLWLFVGLTTPDGRQRQDTINVELADVYGKWKGKGISLYTYPARYEHNLQYFHTGVYTYTVKQGMREENLPGISDVGLKVVNVAGQ
jgi:gliding motility-associated lipoprotein GldH